MMEQYENVINRIKRELIGKLEYLEDVSDENLKKMIGEELQKAEGDLHIPVKKRIELSRQIFHSMRKLDILQDFLEDESVTEIMINGPNNIFVERAGRLYKSERRFDSEETLRNVIQQIVAKCNRVVNESSPIVDARLGDGSRVNVVLSPVALNGPILTIRRFPKDPFMMKDLIRIGSLDNEVALFLEKLVISGYNIIISGGTGSGKTTFLNALSAFIPADERIITIEDSAELQIQGIDNLVRMETKNANTDAGKAIVIRDLIKTSLRMRPTRIIVGECRGGEAMDMICSAMNCGHDGSMSTVHANSATDSIARLETMILMAAELPVNAIRRQIAGGVDIIVQLGRLRDKSRRVLEIVEVEGFDGHEVLVNPIYRFKESGESKSSVIGRLEKVGELKGVEKLKAAGIN
jgi:pilus assembly protein CpaF